MFPRLSPRSLSNGLSLEPPYLRLYDPLEPGQRLEEFMC